MIYKRHFRTPGKYYQTTETLLEKYMGHRHIQVNKNGQNVSIVAKKAASEVIVKLCKIGEKSSLESIKALVNVNTAKTA